MEAKRISVSIPVEYYEVAESMAKREGLSMSAYIRKMVMTNYPIKEEVEKRAKKLRKTE